MSEAKRKPVKILFFDYKRINGIRQAEALAWGNKRERRIL